MENHSNAGWFFCWERVDSGGGIWYNGGDKLGLIGVFPAPPVTKRVKGEALH